MRISSLIIGFSLIISPSIFAAQQTQTAAKEINIEKFKDLIRNYDKGSNLDRLNPEIWNLLNGENSYNQKQLKELDNFLRIFINNQFESQRQLSLIPQRRKINRTNKFDSNVYFVYGCELKLPWRDKAQINDWKYNTFIGKKQKWALLFDNPEETYLTPGSDFFEKLDQNLLYMLFLNQLPSNSFEFVKAALNTNANDLSNAYNIRNKLIVFLLSNVKHMYLFESNLRDASSLYFFEEPNVKGFQIGAIDKGNAISLILFPTDNKELSVYVMKGANGEITQDHIDFIIHNFRFNSTKK